MRKLAFALLFGAACNATSSPQSQDGDLSIKVCPGTSSGAKIVTPQFPAESVIVATKDLGDYLTVDPAANDMTPIFDTAMRDVVAAGGGTLWIPAGTYRFDSPLQVPPTVTLRGDWKQPTDGDKSVQGTIFAIHYADGPFMRFTSDASVDGVSFWYPDQSLAKPLQKAVAIAWWDNSPDTVRQVTVRNVTLVNPTVGIDSYNFAPPDDTGGGHVLWNVYGAALDTFEILRKTSSVSHHEEQHLAAAYWSESMLPGAPAYASLAPYMQAHARGVVYLDNWSTTNLTIADFDIGIELAGDNINDVVTGQESVGVEITNANRAVHIVSGNTFYLNNATLGATVGASPAAVYVEPSIGKAALVLNEVTLTSAGIAIDNESSHYTVDVSHSTFTAWSGYAIRSVGGDVIVAGSDFRQAGAGNKDLFLGGNVDQALIMSNTFADGYTHGGSIPAANLWDVKAQTPLVLAGGINGFGSSGFGTHIPIPAPPKPAHTELLFDVACFNAVADCTVADFDKDGVMTGSCTDNTGPIQAALDAAGKAGGGTVYIPGSTSDGGYWVAGHLAIPDHVELLGSEANRNFRALKTRTIVIIQGDITADGQPFATLGAHAGVRGLMFWYANQDGYHPKPFGYTLQAKGAGDWAINVFLPNATFGLDFGTFGSDDHFMSGVESAAYSNALLISKSSNGFVLDWGESGGGGDASDNATIHYPSSKINPPDDINKDHLKDTDVNQPADAYAHGVGMRIGSAKNETILNAYMHSPHTGLQTFDDGGGPSLTLLHYGSESFTGVDLQALDPTAGMKVVLSQYHTIATGGYPQNDGTKIDGQPYLIVGPEVTNRTPIKFYTLANHAFTPIGFDLHGGAIVIQSYYSDLADGENGHPVQQAISVNGGGNTRFALVGGKFLNPIDNGYVVDNLEGSPNVAFAGMRMQSTLRTSGPVDLSFQPMLNQTP